MEARLLVSPLESPNDGEGGAGGAGGAGAGSSERAGWVGSVFGFLSELSPQVVTAAITKIRPKNRETSDRNSIEPPCIDFGINAVNGTLVLRRGNGTDKNIPWPFHHDLQKFSRAHHRLTSRP